MDIRVTYGAKIALQSFSWGDSRCISNHPNLDPPVKCLLHYAGMTLGIAWGRDNRLGWWCSARPSEHRHILFCCPSYRENSLAGEQDRQLGIGAPNRDLGPQASFAGGKKNVAWLLFKSILKLFLHAAQLRDGYDYSSQVFNCFTSASPGAPSKLIEREKQPSEKKWSNSFSFVWIPDISSL